MIGTLWRQRERPNTLARFAKVWAKRLWTLPGLARIVARTGRLRRRGARIGDLAVVGEAHIEGRLPLLTIGREAALGQCKLSLHAAIDIGERAVVNDGVVLLTASHGLGDPHWRHVSRPILIGAYAWVAEGAMILPGVRIGRGAVVGAGAVVREDVPDYALAIGNPAVSVPDRRVRTLDYSPVAMVAPIEAWLGPRPRSGLDAAQVPLGEGARP
ncbi:MAG: hypothetical protein NW205_03155 [Hyphomicrobiaceae bacterium]|nr:hypothetical protein [Hyphomicrobiaceae bacterium]